MLRPTLAGLALTLFAAACSETAGPMGLPQPPGRVFVSPRFNAIEITWLDASGNEDVFLVEVGIDNEPFDILINVPRNTTVAQFPNPEPGHVYRFRVSACNRAGCSEVREVSVDTKDWLKPTLNSVTAVATGTANLMVTVNLGTHGHPVDVTVVVSNAMDPSFRVERSESIVPNGDPGSADQLIKQYFFSGLLQGNTYFYQVSLKNAFGTTTASAQPILVDFSPPQLQRITTTSIASTRVDFELSIRPGGLQTLIFLSIVPVDSAHVTGTIPRAFTAGAPDGSLRTINVAGVALTPNTLYKARFTITNDAGSVTSADVLVKTLP